MMKSQKRSRDHLVEARRQADSTTELSPEFYLLQFGKY
jgi:hypothetical protein